MGGLAPKSARRCKAPGSLSASALSNSAASDFGPRRQHPRSRTCVAPASHRGALSQPGCLRPPSLDHECCGTITSGFGGPKCKLGGLGLRGAAASWLLTCERLGDSVTRFALCFDDVAAEEAAASSALCSGSPHYQPFEATELLSFSEN